MLAIKNIEQYRKDHPDKKWCWVDKETGEILDPKNHIHFIDCENKPRMFGQNCEGLCMLGLEDKYYVYDLR